MKGQLGTAIWDQSPLCHRPILTVWMVSAVFKGERHA